MKMSTLMFWCIIGILLCVAGLYNEFTDQSITNWIYTGLSAKRTNWTIEGMDKHCQTLADKYTAALKYKQQPYPKGA